MTFRVPQNRLFPERATPFVANNQHAVRTPDFTRQDDLSLIYNDRHPDNGHSVSGVEFETATFYELFRTDLDFSAAVRHLQREVNETFNDISFACHDAFEHPLLQNVVADDIVIMPVRRNDHDRYHDNAQCSQEYADKKQFVPHTSPPVPGIASGEPIFIADLSRMKSAQRDTEMSERQDFGGHAR